MALTKTDLNKIDNLITVRIDDNNNKIEAMFTKFRSDFYDKIDPILKEVQASCEERTITNHRLTKLEEIHKTGAHSLSAFD